jgi:hypothetical protein
MIIAMTAKEAEKKYDEAHARWITGPTRDNHERLDRIRATVFVERRREQACR